MRKISGRDCMIFPLIETNKAISDTKFLKEKNVEEMHLHLTKPVIKVFLMNTCIF